MTDWRLVDLGDYDSKSTDKAKIQKKGVWVPCRICRQVFKRIRLTARYCESCKRGFCEGEHGSFAGGGPAVCVRCLKKAGDLAE